ncbi:MAG: SDR family NAD(P)-dependent oxidoreductase [Thermodesulfobacteriota bacterium]
MPNNISGNRALVLGGNCTPALELARKLLQQGTTPILTWRSQDALEQIEDHLRDQDGNYQTLRLDFHDQESLQSLEQITPYGIDFLIDFAHGELETLLAGAEDELIYEYFSANISFRAALVKRVAQAMLANRKGRMVYISSTATVLQNPGQGFYAASKSACEALYRGIGLEMGKKGITSVILQPGYISSGRGKRYLEKRQKHPGQQDLEVVTPARVADTVCFLLSAAGSGFNACTLRMDGGLCSRK